MTQRTAAESPFKSCTVKIVSGPRAGEAWTLVSGVPFGIGRIRDNDVVLRDPAVGRRHAVVKFDEGRVVLRDQGSSNATHVNNMVLSLADLDLDHGDRFEIGSTRFEVFIAR